MMKIAVTSALSWPYIRRGNRCGYDLGRWLAARGHDVTFITPTPGRRERILRADGMSIHRIPLQDSVVLTALKIQKLVRFARSCQRALDQGGFDIVHATHPIDACAASRHRAHGGAPYVFQMIDCNPFHPPMRLGLTVLRSGLKRASALSVLSEFMNRRLQADHGRQALMLSLAADLNRFAPSAVKDHSQPTILCTASLSDPRKRVDLLIQAFEILLTHVPHASLLLSGQSDEGTESLLARLVTDNTRRHIAFLGLGRQTDLPQLYQTATISVLPSVHEAFGLVVIESLASGTPVVATRSGAIPEILDDSRVGVLFPENGTPDDICDAMMQGILLSKRVETPLVCRSHVEQRYSWDIVGRSYEKLYEEILKRESRTISRPERPPSSVTTASPPSPSPCQAFDDALDGRELTGEEYFQIDRYRPAYEAISRLWLQRGKPQEPIIVIAPGLDLLGEVMSKIGANVLGDGNRTKQGTAPVGIVAALMDGQESDLLFPLLASLSAGGYVALLRPIEPRLKPSNQTSSLIELGGHMLTIIERLLVAPREPILRGWGSTPIKTILMSLGSRITDSLLPSSRSHELLWLSKP